MNLEILTLDRAVSWRLIAFHTRLGLNQDGTYTRLSTWPDGLDLYTRLSSQPDELDPYTGLSSQ